MNAGFIVALWILGNFLVVGAYDVYGFFFLPPDASVSYWVQKWFQDFPVLAVAIGIVLGHLAWPLHKSEH
jgi:hypothetical protein